MSNQQHSKFFARCGFEYLTREGIYHHEATGLQAWESVGGWVLSRLSHSVIMRSADWSDLIECVEALLRGADLENTAMEG